MRGYALPEALRRHRGLLWAVLVASAVIGARWVEQAPRYARFHLPAFDGHV